MALALLCSSRRSIVSNRTCAILTMMAGAAFGAFWWTTQRQRGTSVRRGPERDRGTVIFDNHTTAVEVESVV
jgi:hypothetical protein